MRKITNEELGRPTAGEFAAMEKMPVTVVLDNVRSLQNVGAFFRTGDAFAVEHIALCGITAVPPNRDIHKTALGAELTVPWSYYETTEACIDRLHADGYEVLAVEQVELGRTACCIYRLDCSEREGIGLVSGYDIYTAVSYTHLRAHET